MATSYSTHLRDGFGRPKRQGDRINYWGSRVGEIAQKLDKIDLPDEAVVLLRELFEEIGQLTKDASR